MSNPSVGSERSVEVIARGLCKQIELVPFCDCNSEVREDDPTCDYCYIKQALTSFAKQEVDRETAHLAKYLSLSPEEVKEDGFFGRALARKLKEVEDLKAESLRLTRERDELKAEAEALHEIIDNLRRKITEALNG